MFLGSAEGLVGVSPGDGFDDSGVFPNRASLLAEISAGIDPAVTVGLGFGDGVDGPQARRCDGSQAQAMEFTVKLEQSLVLRPFGASQL